MRAISALLYRFGVKLYHLSIAVAVPWNKRARKWIIGRRGVFTDLERSANDLRGCIWFHCASLGEFEQGRPIVDQLIREHPKRPILITFFSPSGFEVRKAYEGAHVSYLPKASTRNAKRFLEIVQPLVAVFIKYEFWYHYFVALQRESIPVILSSANLRPNHWLFRWYGRFILDKLRNAHRIFVQNQDSWKHLAAKGFSNLTLAPDTRFDRVAATAQAGEDDPIVQRFAEGSFILMAGSTWQPDEKILVQLVQANQELKLVIAPHIVSRDNVERVRHAFGESTTLYSEPTLENARVLIIDNIGILARIYRYGTLAYVGGGFSGKLHNVLEPAAFGLPTVFGPRFSNFPEAIELIGIGAGFPVSDGNELASVVGRFMQDQDFLKKSSAEAGRFVEDNTGGTQAVFQEIISLINKSKVPALNE